MTLRVRQLLYGSTLLALGAVLSACSAPHVVVTTEHVPAWLQERISVFQAATEQSWVVAVYAWNYRGQNVYEMLAGCCDRFNALYDAHGQYLCAPSGGFTGAGDGKCPDALAERYTNKKSVRRIWPVENTQMP